MENRLETLRKEQNLNQQELADVLEVSRQTVISLEKGKYNPSLELAFKISRFFKQPIEEIFLYSPEE